MTAFHPPGPGGLIPAQVWDTEAIPERFLYPAKPGSAMPLVWAHAAYLKLLSAMKTGEPLELFTSGKERYAFKRPEADTWRSDTPFDTLPKGKNLIIEGAKSFCAIKWMTTTEKNSTPKWA